MLETPENIGESLVPFVSCVWLSFLFLGPQAFSFSAHLKLLFAIIHTVKTNLNKKFFQISIFDLKYIT